MTHYFEKEITYGKDLGENELGEVQTETLAVK